MRERLFVKLSTIVMRIISKSFEVSARKVTQRPIVVFHRSAALPSPPELHDSIFCLDKLEIFLLEEKSPAFSYFQSSDLAHSSIKGSSYHLNKVDKCHWTGTPNYFPANQPPGEMFWKKYQTSLPGFEGHGTIAVKFTFYDGIQGLEHPNPGMPFKGTQCIAYLPETSEGKEVLKLLRKAFAACLLFTISCSAPEGIGNVSLNDIELKTSLERHSR